MAFIAGYFLLATQWLGETACKLQIAQVRQPNTKFPAKKYLRSGVSVSGVLDE
jgi:hypothetical protein